MKIKATMALSEKLEDSLASFAHVLTEETTGVNSSDEEALQEFGENSWFGELEKQQLEIYSLSVYMLRDLFKKLATNSSTKRFERYLEEADTVLAEDLSFDNEHFEDHTMETIIDALNAI